MRALRRTALFRTLSLMLLALFVPVQVAGCCKLGAFFWNPEAGTAASAASEMAWGMAPDHSCCPKPQGTSPGDGPQAEAGKAEPCEPGGTGCCLESTGPSEPALAASPVPAPKLFALIRILPLPAQSDSRVERGWPTAASSRTDGPPLYLVHRSLLI